MPRRDVRQLAITTAARLFGTDGYSATGLTRILDESGAPKGSFYFHFPDGKEQLGEEAVAAAAAQMQELIFFSIERAGENGASAVETLAAGLADRLVKSEYAAGGPITALTLETAHLSERLRTACATAYDTWISQLADHFVGRGETPERANSLAELSLSTLEGALALAKARRDDKVIVRAAESLRPLLP